MFFLFPEHDESSARQSRDPGSVWQREEMGIDLWSGTFFPILCVFVFGDRLLTAFREKL